MAIDEILLNEHEQSERVRSWLRSNAPGIIGGIALGLAAIAGWNWWQGQREQAAQATSQTYMQAVQAFEAGKLPADQGRAILSQLQQGNPALATLAGLQLAKAQLEAGKRDEAIATLRGLRDIPADLQPLWQERLARLLIDAGKPREALPLLGNEREPAILDALGDARFALGDKTGAQAAYRKALALLDVAAPQHRLLEMKLIEAGGTPPHTEDKS
ncbi:YfgM family protein [Thermomonas hydrothermalis]|uniref:Ancillary SecYEG translocon subunit n=1 Tax=Thermomonas hydrothermalis TaxID=213588 RepID=A0A1M4XBE9_9GAMM|nr:tetratricopeptide repeat protein [Thermomonas hydrothermalis]SHE90847.1 Putative negative regulator of RcsB-dependent stress response [Thermomonas hydrothermalis]